MTKTRNEGTGLRQAVWTGLVFFALSGCALFSQDEDERPLDSFSAEELYRQGEFTLEEGDEEEAAALLLEMTAGMVRGQAIWLPSRWLDWVVYHC